jgi:hypothetical protein
MTPHEKISTRRYSYRVIRRGNATCNEVVAKYI